MSGLFLTGKIKTLLDRLTSTRATNLDYLTSTRMNRLDTNVGSRQSESNALARYNALDSLIDGAITDIGNIPTSSIKSLQVIVADDDGTFTISAVNVSKTVIITNGYFVITSSSQYSGVPRCYLNSSTALYVYGTASFSIRAHIQVVEFY